MRTFLPNKKNAYQLHSKIRQNRNTGHRPIQIPRYIFMNKQSSSPYFLFLKQKCSKTLQLLRERAQTDWGTDQQILLKLYRILIRLKINNGCYIYGSAWKTYQKTLQTAHYEWLRLILETFKTSPVDSLHTEALELSLQIWFEKGTAHNFIKLNSRPTNPAYDCTFGFLWFLCWMAYQPSWAI